MHQNGSITADHERIPHAIEIQSVNNPGNGLKVKVAANHARPCRCGNSHDQCAGSRIDVRAGQDGPAGLTRALEPRPRARVVVRRHFGIRPHGKGAIGGTEVAEIEGFSQRALLEQRHQPVRTLALDILCQILQQQNTTGQPVADIVRRQRPGVGQIRLQIGLQSLALQVIVIDREDRKGRNHDQGRGQQDLLIEAESGRHRFCLEKGV